MNKLERIWAEYERDEAFSRYRATYKRNFVPGMGNPEADVVLIGEAPGANEDKNRRPFCGQAGNVLDVLLYEAGLHRRDVWTTNVFKYRPPNNDFELLTQEARSKSIDYLRREIKCIGAHFIVTLGARALNVIDPDASVTVRHGTTIERGPFTYFVMYHPAVALYDPRKRDVLHDDAHRLRDLLSQKVA